MDDFMKTEAKDIISTAIEKASGMTGINVEVSFKSHALLSTLSPLNLLLRRGTLAIKVLESARHI